MQQIQHVFIIGAKGISGYGGYETFVSKLIEYQQKKDRIKYHIACKKNGNGCMAESNINGIIRLSDTDFLYNNARCFKIEVPEKLGSAQAVYYDIQALNVACKYIEKYKIQHSIIYILACRIGPFINYYYQKIHKLGGKIYLNPDGHEWLRAKWNVFIRRYWKYSEKLMVKHSDLIICDSLTIKRYIQKCYKISRTLYISYGAETKESKLEDSDKKLLTWYSQKRLSPKEYYLVVGRFVPENNYETMIREFMKSRTNKSLAIITTENAKYFMELEKKLGFNKDQRIKFVGAVYDSELLKKIRENAYGYIHGHEVGGTNPSLLESLGSTNLNLLLDIGFNREVAENAALYWTKKQNNLATLIDRVENMEAITIQKLGIKAKKRITEAYSWPYIVNQYEDVFLATDDSIAKQQILSEEKKIHRSLLGMLKKFDEICRKNEIEYTLHGGTLLGAIREKGFIPWDDDADIAMTRKEYERLKFVLDKTDDQFYLRGRIKVQFRDKTDSNVWIDIFICDFISERSHVQKLKQGLLTALDIMLRDKESIKYSNLEKYSISKRFIYKIIYYFGRFSANKWKQYWYIKVSRDFFVGKKQMYIRSNDQYIGRKIVMPIEWMAQFHDIEFEAIMLKVTQNSKEVLVSSYGNDYMTPIKEKRTHEIHNHIRKSEKYL